MKSSFLRFRLLRLLAFPIMLSFFLTGIFSYFKAYNEAEEIYDAQLVHYAKVMLELTKHEMSENDTYDGQLTGDNALPIYHAYEMNFAYRIWKGDQLLMYSNNAENFGAKVPVSAFSERLIGPSLWRFFVLPDGEVSVEVAESYVVRDDLIEHILEGIFLPQLIIIPMLLLILWLGVSHGIKPLSQLSNMINKRNPSSLESINLPVIPTEVMPVVNAINRLMSRISEVMEREKHFSDYAAHELRTPLAAIKTQIQVALHTQNSEKSNQLFADTLPAIDRMQHLVQQLLSFVRVQRKDVLIEKVDFSALLNLNLIETAGDVSKKNRNISANIDPHIVIQGNQDMLAVLVNNLLSNAIKYTLENGYIQVSLFSQGDGVDLLVQDDGIGISEANRSKIFDSFYRVSECQAEGCGLGLSIVKLIADFHVASIHINQGLNGKGTAFRLHFKRDNSHLVLNAP